jgi:hypothetical protein
MYPQELAWAVNTISRYLARDLTCLPQALVVHQMLSQRGYSAKLLIGVAKGEHDNLVAHAWVETEGKVVIGGAGGLEKFTRVALPEGNKTEPA